MAVISVTTDNATTEHDFVGAVYAADENVVYAIGYDGEGCFGKIEISGGEFIRNWIDKDSASYDVHMREGADDLKYSLPQLTDISGDYQDRYCTMVSADGFEKDDSDYFWSLSQKISGSYIISSNDTETGFLQQYPDGSVFFMDEGFYYNGWIKNGVICSFVADEESAEMYISPRI
ncbi:hypothetical protein [Methanoplanus endosymbiosus]|uniref:Uncharacterized protein n=1 Tax=Methanoplanus endosymbiosus TaxID=33865 RepID=A0A9E7PQU4_9EURY|nr:hypothetical protein [Methanoplanus endosymbiosus]UUX93251.1 hypothetical protein L6E24_03760 [Methanoplanus endosymbiosus]